MLSFLAQQCILKGEFYCVYPGLCFQSFTSIFEEVTQGLGAAFQDTLANVTEEEFNLAVAGVRCTSPSAHPALRDSRLAQRFIHIDFTTAARQLFSRCRSYSADAMQVT